MHREEQFANFYNHDFIRVAVAIPKVRVADPVFNTREIIALMRQAEDAHAIFVLFPELGISAYSCDDLFHQRALLDASLNALRQIVDVSRSCSWHCDCRRSSRNRSSALQLRSCCQPRAHSRHHPQDLPSELPRVLLTALFCSSRCSRARRDRTDRTARYPFRQSPDVSD